MQLEGENKRFIAEDKNDFLRSNASRNKISPSRLQKSSDSEIAQVFSAPARVNPYKVVTTDSQILNTDSSKLVLIWPQNNSSNQSQIPRYLVPVLRALLIGLFSLDLFRLWPGEFMPSRLPSALPPPLPPIKCNVIEPSWSSDSSQL